jgi:potassium-dependent mechanosensitive channel
MFALRLSGFSMAFLALGLLVASPLAAQLPPLPSFQSPTQGATASPATDPATAPATGSASQEPGVQFVGLDTVKQELGQSWADIWSGISKVLGIPLIAGATAKDPPALTVGTLCIGLVLLVCGYFAAGMISRWTASKLLTRFGLNKSAISPIQSITFYMLLGTFTMFSLNVLNVPMTVFSFLGGALAIGAGFGSQNIVNNFISGLILLAERPIRVGDTIQLDTWTGTVTQIGARSTKITNGSNHEIIVPNSKLLETSVVNWTLSDDTICCEVKVGAAYGSPTREVERLLKLAALQHERILRDPAPIVVFTDFGADALMFELRFWLHLRQTNKTEVESDLRFAIDELFADRGLVIAYPQRDVHLNVLRPVEVRIAQPTANNAAQPTSYNTVQPLSQAKAA